MFFKKKGSSDTIFYSRVVTLSWEKEWHLYEMTGAWDKHSSFSSTACKMEELEYFVHF